MEVGNCNDEDDECEQPVGTNTLKLTVNDLVNGSWTNVKNEDFLVDTMVDDLEVLVDVAAEKKHRMLLPWLSTRAENDEETAIATDELKKRRRSIKFRGKRSSLLQNFFFFFFLQSRIYI